MAHKRFFNQAFAFLALALIIALALAACSNPAGPDLKTEPLSEIYKQTKGTKTYELTITQSAANAQAKSVARAAFTPAAGDTYVLKITENGLIQISSGTVKAYSNNKFTLAASTNVSVTFDVTINSSGGITNITGTITVQSGDTVAGPGSLTTSSGGGGGGGGGSSSGGSTTNTAKAITITGIPAEYLTGTTYYYIFVNGADGKCIAFGPGQLSGSAVSSDLYIAKYTGENSFTRTEDRWTGTGTFNVGIQLGNSSYGTATNISITSAVTTIPASQFQFGYYGTQGDGNVIKITGIPAEDLTDTKFDIFVDGADGKCIAFGHGQLSGSTVTCDLYVAKYTGENSFTMTSDRWTGTGTFTVGLSIYKNNSTSSYKYGTATNISITSAVTTIPASQFDIYEEVTSFTTVAAFQSWINGQPDNSEWNPYTVVLEVSSLDNLSEVLKNAPNKYVSIDFSGSTFTSIMNSAFQHCTSLTSVTIPDSVIIIGHGAFSYCYSLASVTIPDSVTMIDGLAFYWCMFASVTIPASVTSIGDIAFSDCQNLTAINVDAANTAYSSQDGVLYNKTRTILKQYPAGKTDSTFIIPSSVTSIDRLAFSRCRNLASVTIPASVTSIGELAFRWCRSLTAINVNTANTAYSSQDGILYNKGKTILKQYPAGKAGSSFIIPNSVTSIETDAFSSSTSLASVTIPNSVTNIGDYAFGSGVSITSVTFQGTITSDSFGANSFPGDLRDKFYATNPANGTPGTYTRPSSSSDTWTKR